MDYKLLSEIVIYVIGGLGIFLLGMKHLSEGMQAVAGERLRRMISAVTDNRIVACGVGASVTGIVQSSSVTTVMVVGMVNAGLMTLRQATGVIMGTNIGTTITAWLVAMHIADYGLPILGIAALVYLFSKNEKVQYTALVFLGLGMVFFGLELMKTGLKPLRSMPEFISLMATFAPTHLIGLLKCVFIGAFTTAIVQSSSATVAITITLASTGAITFETAAALVLGENIGTSITAFLASLGTNSTAKRAAFAHILFNVIGVTIMIPIFQHFVLFLNWALPEHLSIASKIAFAHTFFNSMIVLLLLPLLVPFTRLVELIIPAKKVKEKSHLTYLDIRLYDSPGLAIQQSHREIILMGENIQKMMNWLRSSMDESAPNKPLEDKLFHRERIFDIIQKEIVEFIDKMMTGTLSRDITTETRRQLRMADEYESISDYIVTILKLRCRMRNSDLKFTESGKEEIIGLHDYVNEYLNLIAFSLKSRNEDALSKIQNLGDQITHRVKEIRTNHLERLEKKETSALISLIYMDMLSSYRRIKDHALNIAEVMAGEK
ncbi:Na/Pi cotransporter family protein [candidate division KSB1 bacterium]|nr:Na/Pi cotransporter family protein [candidate division KSB1 bacterium]